jgi:dCMP deaminase
MSNNWDDKFIRLAKEISTWSKDPSTQVGAVIINENRRILATGYNGFPRGIRDIEERLSNRDEKYKFVVHAEMNAIYNATFSGVSLDGATLYVWGLPACSECAKGIIQVGIKRVVMADVSHLSGDINKVEKWQKSFEISSALFDEATIEYKMMNVNE